MYLSKVQCSSIGCSIASKFRRVRWVGRGRGTLHFKAGVVHYGGSILLLEIVKYNFLGMNKEQRSCDGRRGGGAQRPRLAC